jgi:Ubiquinol-cytochrome C reductase, UQCRX/QCR9 like
MKAIYNLVMKRTSTYAVAILGSVFFFERGFDIAADSLFESINKGVSKNDYLIKNLLNIALF